MRKTSKHKKQNLKIRSWVAAIVVIAGGLGLAAQANATLILHKQMAMSRGAVVLAGPKVQGAASSVPAPVPTPTKTPLTRKRVTRLAYAPRPMPIVAAAPGSSVSHLVPLAPSPAPSVDPTTTPSPIPGRGSGPVATATYASTNWAGYMSPAGNFTSVKGSWTVPNAAGNGHSTSADAAWIGIGGVTSSDLIQVGTDEFVSRTGQASYEAFYEMLPDASTPVPAMIVGAGDVMSADITLVSVSLWKISITDVTRGETFSTSVAYASSQSSAEWIQEEPSYGGGQLVPLDLFGTVNFTSSGASQGGIAQTLAGAGGQSIMLVDSRSRPIATPSAIEPDGESFSVTYL